MTLSSYQVYFSLYQQLVGDDDEEHFRDLFRPDFFDLVIVDECHRGSAKEDSRWRRILDYFCGAAQIGMTATPKETRYVSNIDYFGEPLYTYSLNSGIEDGYLAPFRILQIRTNIGDGWRPKKDSATSQASSSRTGSTRTAITIRASSSSTAPARWPGASPSI